MHWETDGDIATNTTSVPTFQNLDKKKKAEDPQDLFQMWKMHGMWSELSIRPI